MENKYFNLDEKVNDVLVRYPVLIDFMVNEGFSHLASPVMRETVASKITLKEAFSHHKKDEKEFEEKMVRFLDSVVNR